MHTYIDTQGFPPGIVAPLSRADLVWLMSVFNVYRRRDLDDNFGEEDDNTENDVDDEWGLFPMI